MENTESGLENLTGAIESAITGIPAPIRKNFLKAFGQLCTAAVDIPVALLEGKAAEIRAANEARIQIIKKEGNSISERIEAPKEYILKASEKFASKIVKEQLNLDEIILNATQDLTTKTIDEINDSTSEIEDDWLNEFENIARIKSSEDMKLIFGKILSGEISKPGTFSIRTLRLISQLDNRAAELFQKLCSQAVSMRIGNITYDARVVSFSGNAATNTLSKFGLSFDNLNILQEYGLIISDYHSNMGYTPCVLNKEKQVMARLRFGDKNFVLMPTDGEKYDNNIRLNGVSLTNSAKELLSIIPIQEAPEYRKELDEFFSSKYLKLIEVEF